MVVSAATKLRVWELEGGEEALLIHTLKIVALAKRMLRRSGNKGRGGNHRRTYILWEKEGRGGPVCGHTWTWGLGPERGLIQKIIIFELIKKETGRTQEQ